MTPAKRNSRAKRIVIPLFVGAIVVGIMAIVISSGNKKNKPDPDAADDKKQEVAKAQGDEGQDESADESGDETGDESGDEQAANSETTAGPPDQPKPGDLRSDLLSGLSASAPDVGVSGAEGWRPVGSLNPNTGYRMQLDFLPEGAGLRSIILSEYWQRAKDKRIAEDYEKILREGGTPGFELPPLEQRYALQSSIELDDDDPLNYPDLKWPVGPLTAVRVHIDDAKSVVIMGKDAWRQTDHQPGIGKKDTHSSATFTTRIVNGQGEPIAEITRQYTLNKDAFGFTLTQRVRNLTEWPLDISLEQYGPSEMQQDRASYVDKRQTVFGAIGTVPLVLVDNGLRLDHGDLDDVRKDIKKSDNKYPGQLWPSEDSEDEGYKLSWIALTNRYFGVSIHPPPAGAAPVSKSLAGAVKSIDLSWKSDDDKHHYMTTLTTPSVRVEPGKEANFDLGVFAGPLQRDVLGGEEPYETLNMSPIVQYLLSACCSFCTWQWLATFLLWLLTFFETYVVQDWGLAIIVLVLIVRGLLHPLTKKSQITMQRFSKQVQAIKPELDRLKKKYGGDAKRMQQETMRLYREHGINPLQMLGCLPMVLQMPIWIALYAMLYLAVELRQEAAFFGVFQHIGGWQFLADLSSADHFFTEFETPKGFLMWNLTGINLLPILMGVMFFFQQKYMTPPNPSATKEQLQQQKIMKVMMVVLFPIMLYSAPSGLTLYILTSSTFGMLEGAHIRRHIKELDLTGPKPGADGGPGGKKKAKDPMARRYAEAIERAKNKRRGPEKTFKKRK